MLCAYFRWHNSQWLEMIENRAMEDEMVAGYGPADAFDPYIQGTEALDRPEYMFAGKTLFYNQQQLTVSCSQEHHSFIKTFTLQTTMI